MLLGKRSSLPSMNNEYRDKRVLVADNALFLHVALKLAESFGHVDYWTPSINAFPKSNLVLPGDGFKDIHRVVDFWSAKDHADLIVFPDVMFADMQVECAQQGKRVFGARYGENLELKRWKLKEFLIALDMPVAETHLICGIDQLRLFLQDKKDFWVKTSRYRGDFETFRSKTYDHVKPRIDLLESELGARAAVYPFICEAHIPCILEGGYDGHAINGQFPNDDQMCLFGVERKDLGYVGVAKPYGELPEAVRWVNDQLKDYMHKHRYAGLFSSEVRCQRADDREDTTKPEPWHDCPVLWNLGRQVDDMYAFLTDPCCRAASPPSELYMEWVSNWDDVMWRGAAGEFIPLEPTKKYGIEIMLHSSWADSHWQPVIFPEKIRPFVKLRNHCRIEGIDYAVPQSVGLPEIGAVIAIEDDIQEACRQALERGAEVDGYFIEAMSESIQKVITEIHNAQEAGIAFTDDPLPSADEIEELQPTE